MTKIIKGQIYKCAKSYTSKSLGVRAMVFNVTFNNISAISWRSVSLEETGVLREHHRPAASH